MVLELHAKLVIADPKRKVKLRILVDGAELSLGKETLKIIPPKSTWLPVEGCLLDWSLWEVKKPDLTFREYGPEDCCNWEDNNAQSKKWAAERKASFKKFPVPPNHPHTWYITWHIRKTIQEVDVFTRDLPNTPHWNLVPKS